MKILQIEDPKIIEDEYNWFGNLTKRRETKSIILHCSATKDGQNFTSHDIDMWHKRRGWVGIGYNFVIHRNGEIHVGRPENCVGAHCVNHNSNSIGICYIGGLTADGKNSMDTRTTEQKEALNNLLYYLMGKYNLKMNDVHCHNEYASKDCPCFKIWNWREEYLKWLETKKSVE